MVATLAALLIFLVFKQLFRLLAISRTTTDWVDEKAPAIKVNYNENTQQLEFTVDRTVLGYGNRE